MVRGVIEKGKTGNDKKANGWRLLLRADYHAKQKGRNRVVGLKSGA